jgi:hypothetical protein
MTAPDQTDMATSRVRSAFDILLAERNRISRSLSAGHGTREDKRIWNALSESVEVLGKLFDEAAPFIMMPCDIL